MNVRACSYTSEKDVLICLPSQVCVYYYSVGRVDLYSLQKKTIKRGEVFTFLNNDKLQSTELCKPSIFQVYSLTQEDVYKSHNVYNKCRPMMYCI